MGELRQALNVLVEQPPAAPASVDVVADRADRLVRRRRVSRVAAAVAVFAIASAGIAVVARDKSNRDVMLATEGPTSGGYVAEAPGGYIADGTWRLTITRGAEVIELTSEASDDCGSTGVIHAGDEVRGSIIGPGSRLSVGERFACPDAD